MSGKRHLYDTGEPIVPTLEEIIRSWIANKDAFVNRPTRKLRHTRILIFWAEDNIQVAPCDQGKNRGCCTVE